MKKAVGIFGDGAKMVDVMIEMVFSKDLPRHRRTDASLARALGVAPPVVSKMRHNKIPIGPITLIRLHELSDIGTKQIKAILRAAV